MGRRSIVVHVANPTDPSPVPPSEGRPGIVVSASAPVSPPARVGMIVSKSVGGSVTRHSVARRLRAAAGTVVDDLPDGALLVIRALRGAADDDANELAAQLQSGLAKLGLR